MGAPETPPGQLLSQSIDKKVYLDEKVWALFYESVVPIHFLEHFMLFYFHKCEDSFGAKIHGDDCALGVYSKVQNKIVLFVYKEFDRKLKLKEGSWGKK